MGAKGQIARSLRGGKPVVGFEPLAALVDQTHEGNRRIADLRGEQGQIIVGLLGMGIEDAEAAQAGEALVLVGG